MAESQLIPAYLNELRYSLRKMRDADDVVAEVEDHLREAAERLSGQGRSAREAEHEALARFGSAALVSRVFITESHKGAALATAITKRAGVAAFFSPLLIAAGGFASDGIDRGFIHDGGIAAIVVGAAAFFFGCWGVRARAGGLGRAWMTAVSLTVLSPLAALPFGREAAAVLLVAVCAAVAVLSAATYRTEIFPRAPVLLLGVGASGFAAALGGLALLRLDASVYGPLAAPIPMLGFMWCGALMWRERSIGQPPARLAPA